MKVYICYDCYDNGHTVDTVIRKVVDSLEKAMDWTGGGETLNPDEWRGYEAHEVE